MQVMIRMMKWAVLAQQARLLLLPRSLVSTMLTLVSQQSPLLLSMACFVLQQNFHHSGPLPLVHRHDVCVGEESASLADALSVSLEAPEDVDPSHQGVAPPLGESREAVYAKSSSPPTLCKGVPSSPFGSNASDCNASDSEVDVTFLGTEAFVDPVICSGIGRKSRPARLTPCLKQTSLFPQRATSTSALLTA